MPPFSGKQKKKQLQERRQRKKQEEEDSFNREKEDVNNSDRRSNSHKEDNVHDDIKNNREEYKYGADRKGIRSVFQKETLEEITARKKLSYEPLTQRRFMDNDGIPFGSWFNMPGHNNSNSGVLIPFSVEIPTRGWSLNETRPLKDYDEENNNSNHHDNIDDIDNVETREAVRFKAYLHAVDNYPLPSTLSHLQLSSHERNLDVWRQLWRTVEQSDVVVIVSDVRYPILHLPLSLLYYIVRECQKLCLIVLNKADLVPKHILDKWMEFLPIYFKATGVITANVEEAKASGVVCEIPLLPFTSLPVDETAFGSEKVISGGRRRKKNKRRMKLYEQLRTGKVQFNEVDFKKNCMSDENKCCESSDEEETNDDSNDSGKDSGNEIVAKGKEDTYAETENFKGMHKAEWELQCDKRQHKELQIVSDMILTLLRKCRDMCTYKRQADSNNTNVTPHEEEERIVHIGFVGHPNVGKSSLLNCIRGTKVVSVSSTPGHTKHLQTIPIPSEHVVLIDSPGLAFPVFGLPRALQAVIGTHQIAQTRDPQSGVAFLASHLQLERLYGLRKVDGSNNTTKGKEEEEEEWSPYELCESYAKKRGYFVKHGKGVLDIHRGSIEILQEAYEGRLVLFFAPPDMKWLESSQFREEVLPYLLLKVSLL